MAGERWQMRMNQSTHTNMDMHILVNKYYIFLLCADSTPLSGNVAEILPRGTS